MGKLTLLGTSCSRAFVSFSFVLVLTLFCYLVGKMEDLHEKLVKMRTSKGSKVATKITQVQQLKVVGKGVGSEGSSPSSDVDLESPIGAAKKQKMQTSLEARQDQGSPEKFLLPPCILYRGFFTGENSLSLHK